MTFYQGNNSNHYSFEDIKTCSLPCGRNVMEGVSVDWPGWCFDDEEVFGFEDFDDEDWFDPNLAINELRRSETKRSERQDETQCSEV